MQLVLRLLLLARFQSRVVSLFIFLGISLARGTPGPELCICFWPMADSVSCGSYSAFQMQLCSEAKFCNMIHKDCCGFHGCFVRGSAGSDPFGLHHARLPVLRFFLHFSTSSALLLVGNVHTVVAFSTNKDTRFGANS